MNNGKFHTLGKSERLKSRKGINSLFESGKKITLFPYRVVYQVEPGEGSLQAGFAVSTKLFPNAVDRNHLKRLSREAYRLQNTDLKKGIKANHKRLQLFFIYNGREILSYEEISTPIKKLLDKLVRIIYEEFISNT
jgi:ribonuclease P protein component